jgi:outer membrane lipoprotein-sorting protein
MSILRRLPLPRLLLLCGLVVIIGVSATALAVAVGAGPTPPPKPLAVAVHDALAASHGESIEGVSASVTLTDHLLEGASLATGGHGGELTSSPLVTGASGRLWIAKDGDVRLELQSQQGDTQVLFDGHTLTVYDAATNTLYRYTPPMRESEWGARKHVQATPGSQEVPSVAKIEEAIAHLGKNENVSGATPTDVAGQPAYTVRVSPNEGGSLFGGVELSWDANNGIPLRAAIYSSTSSSPVVELAATEVSFGPVDSSVFEINPPSDAKVEQVASPSSHASDGAQRSMGDSGKPKLTTSGHGPSTVAVLEAKETSGSKKGASEPLEGLPKVTIDGASASELRTELGTLLTFERSGVRYLLAGSVTPATIEAVARGL